MMFCSGLFGSVYFLLAIFQCKPISAWWIRKHSPLTKDYGWCFNNTTVVAVTFASSGLNSVADWTFGLLPIFIVKDLQMPVKQKRLVAGILGFANIACVATMVRMPFILNLTHTDDFLFKTLDIALWSNVEPGVGIAAACIATLRPLLHVFIGKRTSGWFSDRNAQVKYYPSGSKRDDSGQSYALRDSLPPLRPDRVGNFTEIFAGARHKKEPMVTGREIRDLYEASDLRDEDDDREQQMHLSAGAADPARSTPTSAPRERTGGLEIQKSVEITFTEEIEGNFNGRHSPSPLNWPMAPALSASDSRPRSYEWTIPPLDTTILDSLGERDRDRSQTAQKRKDSAPGAVRDPFASWR
jgi:hypothetical protein